jgi:hypothetical protein
MAARSRVFSKPCNEQFLKKLSNPLVVPKLSRFNVELNCEPLALTGSVLQKANVTLTELWEHCNGVAHGLDANMVMIGTLPLLRDEDLTIENMSSSKRFEALNSEILRQRDGRPLVINIEGEESLFSKHDDVMMEAAATSFQVHLKTPASVAHRYYNASIIAAGPLLSACVNAPYLFGHSLWSETRIPIFEQSIALSDYEGGCGRVSFGSGYANETLFEVLEENLTSYPILLPFHFDDPAHRGSHLRLHNGTIWRWNRPLIGFEADGTPHFRIEHRTLPAGPTIIDMIANAACYFGLVRAIVDSGIDETGELSFDDARFNFYQAAKQGLDAQLTWPGGKTVSARGLMLDEIIPAAHRGLAAFDVDQEDRDLFLGVLEARVQSGQTGAAWQRAELNRRNGNIFEMMSVYCECQRSGIPVHQWKL